MSNMSYCRFRNTLQDLRDCDENWTGTEYEEDVEDENALSPEEFEARASLYDLCLAIVENHEESMSGDW